MTAPRNVVLRGDCLEVMRGLPADSIDAVVTDPPYELGFMGKSWDSAGVSYDPATWAEALRVLKPGGHLLAFGGSRTYHRIAVAIEDAGFEIRDSLMWIYGSGFPKSLDVSKALDKKAGAEREVVGSKITGKARTNGGWEGGQMMVPLTAPATGEAKKWKGWGTALKPSHEPIVLARKPLIGTVAENVMAHGTGALNIDGARIVGPVTARTGTRPKTRGYVGIKSAELVEANPPHEAGRWPANTLWDEEAAALLDAQSGNRPGGNFPTQRGSGKATGFGSGQPTPGGARKMTDSGGASRFFYVAKPNKRERDAGLDVFTPRHRVTMNEYKNPSEGRTAAKNGSVARNVHPTVKPIALMRYLVRLITPPGGVVLDPFLGSGTTACAARLEGFDYIGIEMDPAYADIAEARIAHWEDENDG